ncbi:hypothetical protein QBC40DRAFT_340947 [Triangularia verruculosa]|uniref:Uncharacterized protein n=1 Tax=Triangularia verruculosa TaxID=2587418 RepID=A0AAN6XEP3_9PEZI|nr:hypothetical protein QBC40DRAFT_340947 [Triangularia verruculosa]
MATSQSDRVAILRSHRVRWFVLGWVAWLGISGALVVLTVPSSRIIIAVLSGVWVLSVIGVLGVCLLLLFASLSGGDKPLLLGLKSKYSQNLGNTVITLLAATITLPFLYWTVWDPERTRNVITFDRDIVASVHFPSITLFQRVDWTSQAKLEVDPPPKCFLGWHNETAPDCEITSAEYTGACQCGNRWSDRIEDFEWQNTSYRAFTLTSSISMVSPMPTYQMIAQAFFTYDTAKARADSSRVLSPSVWIAVYDPTLTVQQALESGYTRMVLINANGMAALNLGLNYREALGKAPAYDYQLSISTVPSMDLQCDTSDPKGASGPCFLSLFVQFPSFERQVSQQDVAMKWQDVAADAGSWFALFQLLGWISSGLAWYKG